ncbi:hypothetical protein Glove_40g52 [Diversispora epigaea]|uniref:Biogenesis of lysosome-related organelles complex 1 subunit 5 n=1 Tax=Diversispora epigaea TaxID=1348612 RepID=A0A397JGL5_9GLOM|nr:hypothetical protein Glove_40g52 [Diversispora epigaea]
MFKQDSKTIAQGKFIYILILYHFWSSVDKEIKLFVQEFESNRNGRETENLKKSIAYAQDAPDKYESGISSLNKKLDGVSKKLKESKQILENISAELTELKKNRHSDVYVEERKEFLREQENAKNKLDQEFKLKEQALISEYRLMMEEALRGVDDFSVISSSGNSGNLREI